MAAASEAEKILQQQWKAICEQIGQTCVQLRKTSLEKEKQKAQLDQLLDQAMGIDTAAPIVRQVTQISDMVADVTPPTEKAN